MPRNQSPAKRLSLSLRDHGCKEEVSHAPGSAYGEARSEVGYQTTSLRRLSNFEEKRVPKKRGSRGEE